MVFAVCRLPGHSWRCSLGRSVGFAWALAACGGGSGKPAPEASALVAPTTAAPIVATSNTVPSGFPSLDPFAWVVSDFADLSDVRNCKTKTTQVAGDLKHSQHALASSTAAGGAFAVAWFMDLSGKPTQLAFGGFDASAQKLAHGGALGSSKLARPAVFRSGTGVVVAWIDEKGLAYSRLPWDSKPPVVEHAPAIGPDLADAIGLGSAENGSVLAAVPFGPNRAQLSILSFASPNPSIFSVVKAVGTTRDAVAPRQPAVVSAGNRTWIAWSEARQVLKVAAFDEQGHQLANASVLAEPADGKRGRVSLWSSGKGALAMWTEPFPLGKGPPPIDPKRVDGIMVRALDESGKPVGLARVVARGSMATLVGEGDAPLLVWVGSKVYRYMDGGEMPDPPVVAALALSLTGEPQGPALAVTEWQMDSVDRLPSAAFINGRWGFTYAEETPVTAARRVMLRTFDASCIPREKKSRADVQPSLIEAPRSLTRPSAAPSDPAAGTP